VLLRASQALGASQNVRQVAAVIRSATAHLIVGTDCHVDVFVGKAKEFRRIPDPGPAQPAMPASVAPDVLTKEALRHGRPTWSTGADQATRMVVPLLDGDRPWGYIEVRALRPPTSSEAAGLRLLAHSASTALETAHLRRAKAARPLVDEITGFHSRWYFHERLYEETARARRYGQPLSAVMFEIDDFEQFVERRGQAAGTYLLRAVARLLKGSMRQRVDMVCRYNGAKFGLLLPNTSCSGNGAGLVAERLRATLEATEFKTEGGELVGRFTLSAGMAGFPSQSDDAEELAAAADTALARARRTGGNRTRVYRG
jgi:diguanylate cyclase (GGDEF)-like protein